MIHFEQFNKKLSDQFSSFTPDSSTNNIVEFTSTNKESLVSCEEVGYWVDRLMELPEIETTPKASLEKKDNCLELAAKLVNQGLV